MSVAAFSIELSDKQFKRISVMVKEVAGINLHDGKKELVKARLCKRLRNLGISNFDEYLRYLEDDCSGTELVSMLDVISTNLTNFYREQAHFDYLEDVIFTSLDAVRQKTGNNTVRIWSAGCSSGEEPYSIALSCLKCGLDGPGWDSKILATDISTRVLGLAAKGVYSANQVRNVPLAMLKQRFSAVGAPADKIYKIGPEAKKKVSFGRLNLMGDWPMKGPFDVIFCRNVMIYFDKETQEKLVQRYWEKLAPGGILFIGHSESLTGVNHSFKYMQPTIYMRQ